MVYIIYRKSRSRLGRQEDLKQLEKSLQAPEKNVREAAKRAIDKIKHEDRSVREMRESLIKEHRAGNKENIKDVHDIVKKKAKYQ